MQLHQALAALPLRGGCTRGGVYFTQDPQLATVCSVPCPLACELVCLSLGTALPLGTGMWPPTSGDSSEPGVSI